MRLALALAAVLLLPAAGAQAAVCKYLPPPAKLSKAERMLRDAIEMRKSLDFPHRRAYVRRVHADPDNRAPHEGMYPMTPRETRYYWARQALTDGPAYARLHRYMRRHRDEFGELSIEDDFPAGAYLQLRVTRDLARHRAAIRRFGVRFRIELVRYSERELRAIQNAIDFDALEAIGIHPIGAGGRADDDAVTLEVATERTDAQAVVTQMYGPAVRVEVVGPTPTFLTCERADRYEVMPDGRTLKIHFGDSGSITPRHVEVVETDHGVDVGVVVETSFFTTLDLRFYTLTVTLAKPLGNRPVRNIEYGGRVRRGPSPGG